MPATYTSLNNRRESRCFECDHEFTRTSHFQEHQLTQAHLKRTGLNAGLRQQHALGGSNEEHDLLGYQLDEDGAMRSPRPHNPEPETQDAAASEQDTAQVQEQLPPPLPMHCTAQVCLILCVGVAGDGNEAFG